MKELMIAMSAATMFALCSHAGIPTGADSGIDFEDTPEGPLQVQLGDDGESDIVLWSSTAAKGVSEGDLAGTVDSVVVAEEGNKYLKVDETESLQRLMDTDPTDIGDGDITINVDVQFTAADEAPTASEGDKLLVWLRAANADVEPAVPAAVMVTDYSGDNVLYTVGNVDEFVKGWYSLSIKAVAQGASVTATSLFTVTLSANGETLATGEYESLVTGKIGAQTISSIGFKGTGSVDNIAFTKNEAVVIPDVTVSISTVNEAACEGVVLIDEVETEFDGSEIEFTVKPEQTITVQIVADGDATVKINGVALESDCFDQVDDLWTYEYTVTADETQAIVIEVIAAGSGDDPNPGDDTKWEEVTAETPLADVVPAAQVEVLAKYNVTADKVAAWLTGKCSVDGSAIVAATEIDLEAFAMNCAVAEKETVKAALKVTIEMVDGEPNVTIKGDADFNIKPVIHKSTDLKNWGPDVNGNFFKAVIELPTVQAAE